MLTIEMKMEKKEEDYILVDGSQQIKLESSELNVDTVSPVSIDDNVEIKVERDEKNCVLVDDSKQIISGSETQVDTNNAVSKDYCHTGVDCDDDSDGFECNVFFPDTSKKGQSQATSPTSNKCYETKLERDEDGISFKKTCPTTDTNISTKYTQQHLEAALNAVKNKELSQRGAAKKYGVPYTTLGEKIRGRRPEKMGGRSKTPLTPQEEERICQWLIDMSRRGFWRTRHQLCVTVKKILDEEGRTTMFADNLPGRTWYYCFRKRHPELSLWQPKQLGVEKAQVSIEALKRWMEDFKATIVGIDPTLLLDAERIYNADESGFTLCPQSGRVLAMRGERNVYAMSNGNRQFITCLACVSASSHILPPLLIFPGVKFHFNPLKGFESAKFASSSNGWINGDIFSQWLNDVFIPAIAAKKKPVLLLFDGRVSHVTLDASRICQDNGIVLYASHFLQPLDLVFFPSLKQQWEKSISRFQEQNLEIISKQTFASVFKDAWDNSVAVPDVGAKCFRKSGIFPLNINSVNMEKLGEHFLSKSPATASPSQTTSVPPHLSTSASLPTTALQEPGLCKPPDVESDLDKLLLVTEECVGAHGAGGVQLFLTRYREGFDIKDDLCYNEWRSLYEKVISVSDEQQLEPTCSSEMGTCNGFDIHLKLPDGDVWGKKRMCKKRKADSIHCLLSGTEYPEMLAEKKRRKAEEEESKEERKREREEKRKQKELEKERKTKKREEKKKLTERGKKDFACY